MYKENNDIFCLPRGMSTTVCSTITHVKPRPNDQNMSQHCWVQHVAYVWPSCCDVLRHAGCCWLNFDHFQPTTPNMSQHGGQTHATMLRPMPKQHVATLLGTTLLRHVALACCDRLAGAFSRIFDDLRTKSL